MNLEYRAVRAQLSDITVCTHPMGTRFEVGHLSGCRVALALTGKGNQSAAVLTERAAAEFAPAVVIFVGVAGALQPHLGLGDVVVATHVYAYHGATSQDDGITARPRTWELSHRVHQIAAHLERAGDWARQLPGGSPPPRVHFGPVAAGEIARYSAVSDARQWLREHYSDAVAVRGRPRAAAVRHDRAPRPGHHRRHRARADHARDEPGEFLRHRVPGPPSSSVLESE